MRSNITPGGQRDNIRLGRGERRRCQEFNFKIHKD